MVTTVAENRLKFETFKKKRNKTFTPLPKWFNESVYKEVLKLINQGQKLHAIKHIIDTAKLKNSSLGLKEAKEQYLDEIVTLGGNVAPAPFHAAPVAPAHSALNTLVRDLEANKRESLNSIQKNEILRALEPFARLANQCLHNSNLNPNQIVYAYNGAQITMNDLRNIEILVRRLAR